MNYANRIGAIVAVVLSAIGIMALLLTSHGANAQTKINGNELQFIIGPGSKESFFTILDESRGKTQVWACGFIHDFKSNGFGGYTPSIQCNRIG